LHGVIMEEVLPYKCISDSFFILSVSNS
jgi:hypothetical protein